MTYRPKPFYQSRKLQLGVLIFSVLMLIAYLTASGWRKAPPTQAQFEAWVNSKFVPALRPVLQPPVPVTYTLQRTDIRRTESEINPRLYIAFVQVTVVASGTTKIWEMQFVPSSTAATGWKLVEDESHEQAGIREVMAYLK